MTPVFRNSADAGVEAKRDLLAERLRRAAEDPAIPLSFAQQRLWFLDQLEPDNSLYNVPVVVEMTGRLDAAALQRALDHLVQRHEILRTRFACPEDDPVQIVEDHTDITMVRHDLASLPEDQRQDEARRILRAEVRHVFNLNSGPLIRATLIRLGEEQHWFILNLHHVISDEWSLRVCFRELTALYQAFAGNQTPVLPELPIQYADYAVWQREWLKDGALEKQLAYWRRQLDGDPPVLELPVDHPGAAPGFRGKTLARALPFELRGALKDLAARQGATPFMTLLAAFKALLHRYTEQTDVIIGSPIAGRSRVETEDLIGFFVNTLVLRTDLSGNPSFIELLRRVRRTTLAAYAHQDLPFERLVQELHPERTLNHLPFTPVMFALQNTGLDELRWPGLTLRFMDVESDTAKFSLTFLVQETERGFVARVEYNRDLFDESSMARLLEHYEILLRGIIADPGQSIADLPLLNESEQRQMLADWNRTAAPYPREQTVHQLFEAVASQTPGAGGIVFGRETLTWQELNSRANQLAWHLKKFGVGPDVPVGLCVERSAEMVVAMLGILKAGGAYVPMDAGYPKNRLAFMLEDAQTPVLLTQERLLSRLPPTSARVICLDSDWELIARESRANPPNTVTPDHLAYLIYTSGSTGKPKGVAVPHRAIVRLVLNTNYIQLTGADRIAQASNASFDAATFEIWGALLNAARLVGIPRDVMLSPKDFARELREKNISVLFLTTALFNQLAAEEPGAFETVRVVMFGGEAVDPKWVRAVLENRPPRHLLHVYGPTENTTFSTWHEVKEIPAGAHTVPIGKPVANTQCYILDSHLNPAPIGVPGELHLAGDGLARGYWNRPDLTGQRFICCPPGRGAGATRLYKTGDLVRWLPDGSIEFIGRIDQQVKLRGFRVELGEIEVVLAQHPDVRDCAVTMRTDGAGDKKLAAFFVANGRRVPGVAELRQFLLERLPDYMVPSAFVRLDAMPLTPNGKLDRKALPEPDRTRPEQEKRYTTPRDAVEAELTRIWENVLGVHPVGIEDKFFDLGGHSLLAVRVIAQIEKAFGRKLRLATIFRAQTIEQLAAILRKEIQEDTANSGSSVVEIQPKGSRPPIFFVHGAGGGMFWGYVNLSKYLGADQPVYGIRSRALDGREEFQSIEKMAAQYVADIRAVQPRGPYHLGGYCFGGNVAFEMARQLQAQGEEVRTLALFNCAPANSGYSQIRWTPMWTMRFVRNLFYWAKYVLSWTSPQRRDFFRWKTELLKRRTSRFFGRANKGGGATVDAGELVDLSSYSDEQRKLWEAHIHALVTYHPQPYSGPVHLYRSPGHPLLCSFDPDYAWGKLAPDVRVTVVPAAHEKILEEPCVQLLAKKLDVLLAPPVPAPAVDAEPAAPAPAAARSGALQWQVEHNRTAAEFPVDQTYADAFEARVKETPSAIAARFDGMEWTYEELNRRANQLAHHLQRLGVGPESLVAVRLERSLDLLAALLGTLKAGGAYLPLDISYPKERLRYMLEDSQARVLLTRARSRQDFASGAAAVVCLDDPQQRDEISRCPEENPRRTAMADNLAYVIYTSGSTGRPKGVQITHRSLLNHNFAAARAYSLQPADRVLQFTAFSFDISVEEIFPTWLSGCALVMRTDETLASPERFLRFVAEERLTVLNLPTAYWHELVEALQSRQLPANIRLVVIGGEKASDEAWRRWKKSAAGRVVLMNSYGPTEATVTSSIHVASAEDEELTIGKPIANVQMLVLDSSLHPVAPGVQGELYVGGAGLSRGYLHRPELTAERFIANPFPEIASRRLYKTGDLARFRQDGNVEFLGRADEQVKIRGFRIEPGEVENALGEHPGVKQAIVIAREDAPGQKRLVAYFVPREGETAGVSDLLGFLKQKLPPWLVPSAFVPLAAMPLTPGGKVDRRALPAPGTERPEFEQQFVAPRTPVEEVLAAIWSEVLGLDRVGIHDNFFDLGGHSLLATQVISRVRERLKVDIGLADVFEAPAVAALAARLADPANETHPMLPVSAVSKTGQLALSPTQERTWFLDQFDPQQSPYNIATGITIVGPLDVKALEQSLGELARRHEALRSIFPAQDGQPVQIICEAKGVRLPIVDLRNAPEAEREARAQEIAIREARKPYITSSPVLHPVLLQLTDTENRLLVITHQLACDNRSVATLFDELTALYDAFAAGKPAGLKPVSLSYSESAAIGKLSAEEEREHLEFWKRQLAGAPALLDLPADRPRPAHSSDEGARVPVLLTREMTAALEQLGRDHDCPLFVTLLALFQTLLHRYTGSDDIVVGSIVPNRARSELKNLIGNFENCMALRGDLSGNPTFAEFLRRLRRVTDEALAHSALPFEILLDALKPARNAGYTPVYQASFVLDSEPLQSRKAGGALFCRFEIDKQTSQLDLALRLNETPDGLAGWIEFNTDLFDRARIERMAAHFVTLAEDSLGDPGERISRLCFLPEDEARLLLSEWTATTKDFPGWLTLSQLFEAQAQRTPDAVALIAGRERLTYRELNARANQLAHHLRSLGVGPEVLAGICMERSWRMIVGILGVLKAGGAYVPLDPAYPKDRLAFILEDARAPVLLTQASLCGIRPRAETKVLCLDSDWEQIALNSRENVFSGAESHNLAYVIYTSGSTGNPKGVAIEHRNATALICWTREVFTRDEIAGVLASTSICFDLSVFEMFVPLSRGGAMVLAENALALPSLPARDQVTLINTVPSAIRELLRIKGVPPTVRVVNLAGEPLATSLVNQIYEQTAARKAYDLYGPSETTTYSTFTLRRVDEPATIGKPIANEQIYLLDRNGEPVPIGVPGEIHIGGAGVGRGYLNRPELTREKFIANPFAEGTRLYRTGDLGRWRADGNLEFLGRIDHQVKIRGFRIEPGEIEIALRKHPEIREAVVLAREDQPGDKRLVAYLTVGTQRAVLPDELKRFLKELLPEYLVPSAFVFLDALPLTPNGKVDRKALPAPDGARQETGGDFVPPQTPMEKQLAAIWREVLRIEEPGVHDNFFELGGHSLLAIQVVARVREVFKVELPLFSLFDAPTIAKLAEGLGSGQWTQNQIPVLPLEPVPRDQDLPVSFVQERLWFLEQLEPGGHAYNVPMALRLKGPLNHAALQRALNEIANRHEALRTTFDSADGTPRQVIAAPSGLPMDVVEWSLGAADVAARLQALADAEARRPFDLARGPLIRVSLVRITGEDHALIVVMHHTITDGWSFTLFFRELETLYNAFSAGLPAPALPELSIQYADFAFWKRQWMQGAVLDHELAWWKKTLAGGPPQVDLPADCAEPDRPAGRSGGRKFITLPRTLVDGITALSQREGGTPFIVLMSALAITLQKWTRQKDLVIGTVVAGRNHRETENVIGCFMNFLPLRARVSDEDTGRQLIQQVRGSVLDAQMHQDCPFEKIVEAINPERRLNGNPLYNVALLLQNFPAELFRADAVRSSVMRVQMEAALLDLRFEAEPTEEGMSLMCEYRADLFAPETIEQLLESNRAILETLVRNPAAKVGEAEITPALKAQAGSARNRPDAQTIAISATFTSEPVEESLRYWSEELGLAAKIEFAPFNQVFQQLLDPGSLFGSNNRGVNILLIRLEDWQASPETGTETEHSSTESAAELQEPDADLERKAREFVSAVRAAAGRSATPHLVFLCPPSTNVTSQAKRKALVERLEEFLIAELDKVGGVYVVSGRELMDLYPVPEYYDASGDELGRVPYTPVFFTALGTMIARKFHALLRPAPKVIVLDCDQTLWSGVCGEDGARGVCLDEPRRALQEFIRAQHEAGRLLAICSKNNEQDVLEVFAQRLDMPLRPEHFAAWRVNWQPKSDNLKSIAAELNLGLDSFVFLDDNPVECAEVEANCPEVLTLPLPEDPRRIPHFLRHCWIFDHLKLTAEDQKRGEMYRQNRQREQWRAQAPSMGDFLAGLELKLRMAPMTPDQVPRVAQLTQRTNQFNLTTVRRTEADIQKLAANASVLVISVTDRFGDYGLVGVVVCEKRGDALDVEAFLLSCRVLGRGVEHRILAELGRLARQQNLARVDVHFHPTARNQPAADFLQKVGAAHQQALNGGFVYRFPAETAERISFNPRAHETVAGERPMVREQRPSIGKFARCQAIALEANEAPAIHDAIEARAASRPVRRRDSATAEPRTEMERRLCALWEKLLRVGKVGVGDNFFHLGGHSLLAVRLFAEIEKMTGRKFPLVTLFQAPTVEQLARALEQQGETVSRSPIVAIQPNGSRPPLFLIHGAGGDVLWGYANLVKHMSRDQPVYGIKSRGQVGLEEYEHIEEMARYYLSELKAFQRQGPYYLGGYCFGGNVAYEMARQLHGQGEEAALVALLDTSPANAGYERITWWRPMFYFRFTRNFYHWVRDFLELDPAEQRRYVTRKWRTWKRKLIGKLRRSHEPESVDLEDVIDPIHFPEHELKLWEVHIRAIIQHIERPYAGAVTLIRTRGQALFCSFDEDFCWRRLAKGGVTIRYVPGSHENIFMEPNVKSLAEVLEASLAEARARADRRKGEPRA